MKFLTTALISFLAMALTGCGSRADWFEGAWQPQLVRPDLDEFRTSSIPGHEHFFKNSVFLIHGDTIHAYIATPPPGICAEALLKFRVVSRSQTNCVIEYTSGKEMLLLRKGAAIIPIKSPQQVTVCKTPDGGIVIFRPFPKPSDPNDLNRWGEVASEEMEKRGFSKGVTHQQPFLPTKQQTAPRPDKNPVGQAGEIIRTRFMDGVVDEEF